MKIALLIACGVVSGVFCALKAEARPLTQTINLRYWYSQGETEFSFCGSADCRPTLVSTKFGFDEYAGDPASRLNYHGTYAHSAELVGQALWPNGYRFMVYWGLGEGHLGEIRDQDWFDRSPFGGAKQFEFSDTLSRVKSTQLRYATADFGQQLQTLPLLPFVGFTYYREQLGAYGITPLLNDAGGMSGRPVSDANLVLGNEIRCFGLRLGVEIAASLNNTTLLTNIAYLPWLKLKNADSHYLRDDLGPPPNVRSEATGDGWMIDVLLQHAFNARFQANIGYRWWAFEGESGDTRFGPGFYRSQLNRSLFTQRHGTLLGLVYRF